MSQFRPSLSGRLLAGTALTLALAAAGTAQGQTNQGQTPQAQTTPPQTGQPPTTLPTISVEGQQPPSSAGDYTDYKVERLQSPKFSEPLRDTPQAITVIPRALMEDQGVTTLRDALRNVPGITIGAGEGGQQGDQFNIRGFIASNDTFADGMRDISARYSSDAFNLDAIEVVKGPSAVYAGRGSSGGFINLITKTPKLNSFYEGTVTGGTDETKRVTADLNQPLGFANGAIRLNLMAHDQEFAGRDVLNTNRFGIAPSIAFGLETDSRLVVSYLHRQENKIPDYGLPVVNGRVVKVDRNNWYGFKDLNTDETSTDSVTANFEHDITDSATIRNQFRYQNNTRYAIVSPPRNANLATGTMTKQLNGRDQDDSMLTNQTEIWNTFKSDDVSLRVMGGFEYAKETYDQQALSFTPNSAIDNLFNPSPSTRYTGRIGLGNLTETTAHSYGVYNVNTLKFFEQFELIGSLRYDRFAAKTATSNSSGVGISNVKRVDEEPTYRVAGVYKPLPYGSIYVAYGTSFNPSAEQLAIAATQDTTDPETNKSYEAGTKWDLLDEKLAVSAAVFRIEKTNGRSGTDPITGDVLLLGEQRVKGFEIGAAGYVTTEWQIFTGYTYLDSEIKESAVPAEIGKTLPNTPTHSFSLWTTYETPWDLQLGFGAQMVGHRYMNAANTAEVDAYWLLDFMAAYHVTEHIDIRLNIYNLTDRFYIANPYVNAAHAVPGLGRSALLSTSIRF